MKDTDQSQIIEVRSPTRVDLAGGTLDLWPLYNFVGGAVTINLAIDVYTFASLEPRQDARIKIESQDLSFEKEFESLESCLKNPDPRLILFQKQLQYWQPKKGFSLRARSESPVGGGLGGSSSLTISLLKVFEKFLNRPFESVHQMVQVAHNIESAILRTPTGTQDYYPAVTGGLNILKYSEQGIDLEVLDRDLKFLSDRTLVVYTGKSHHSGINNFQVLTKAVQGDAQTLTALRKVKQISEELEKVVKNSQWERLPDLFNQEYAARVNLAEAFTSPEIENLSKLSLREGATAIKICGAGGGGCVLIWVEPSHKERVKIACQQAGFQVLAAKPVGKL